MAPLVARGVVLGLALLSLGATARAQPSAVDFARVEAELARQRTLIEAQQAQIDQLRAERDAALEDVHGRGSAEADEGGQRGGPAVVVQASAQIPATGAPVGAPPPPQARSQATAVPPGYGVLTPRGKFVVEPSLEYVQNSNPRLVFRGVEITPGIQFGVIEASDAQRATGVAAVVGRYGLTERLEVEARIPWVIRRDRITTLVQRDESVTRSQSLDGRGIGDLEVSGRYQINSGQRGRPVLVATARIKAPTGEGPYEVRYDEAGVAQQLATGSGFWAVEAGVSALHLSDPAVIFGGLTYLHNFARDIDRDIGSVRVGRVDPGDAIGATLGFGLSLNPRMAVSFGYSHHTIFATESELGDTRQRSQPLQIGVLQLGGSYRIAPRLTLNTNVDIGVTAEAPDVRLILRAPYKF